MATPSDPVRREVLSNGQVLWLTLNSPKGNILDTKMIEGLGAALDEHDSPRLKAIVFEGEGAHFSFGASVPEHEPARAPSMLATFHSLFRKLSSLAIPTFACVRGQCKGGGMELASYCTWIFASPSAQLGQPEIKLAVFPPMASLLLPWRLGAGRGLDLCVSGRSVTAAEALDMGLVYAITDDPRTAIMAFIAENLLPTSASSLRFAERAARLGLRRLLEETLPALEKLYLEELMKTPDANEGIAAFIEKRKPVFSGEGLA